MSKPLRVLIVEDSDDDAALLVRELRRGGYDPLFERIDTTEAMSAALAKQTWDIIISDYVMPHFSGVDALKLLQESGKDLPFIIVSGKIGEDTAVEAMKAGAHDYIMKNHLARLVPAVDRELRDAEGRRARKRAEKALVKSEERYHSLFDRVPVGLYRIAPNGQILEANPILAEMLGYPYRETLMALNASDIYLNPDDRVRWQTLMEGGGSVHNFEVPCRCRDGTVIWVRENARAVSDADGKVQYYEGAVEDISERMRAEEEIAQAHKKLQRVLEDSIYALASAVEQRDPYTAGHQRWVTNLACDIARELGLLDEQIEAIRMAGFVHDIGKISVPAEILSKPSQLSEIEMGLVRNHSQAGYEILKNIEFPWPIAQIVQQHHYRMDGSGYPQGLSGEDILLEAKIIAVADVVEAMGSPRPYRPACDLGKAVEEISKHSHILYDPEVVDACLNLLAQKEYTFRDYDEHPIH